MGMKKSMRGTLINVRVVRHVRLDIFNDKNYYKLVIVHIEHEITHWVSTNKPETSTIVLPIYYAIVLQYFK